VGGGGGEWGGLPVSIQQACRVFLDWSLQIQGIAYNILK